MLGLPGRDEQIAHYQRTTRLTGERRGFRRRATTGCPCRCSAHLLRARTRRGARQRLRPGRGQSPAVARGQPHALAPGGTGYDEGADAAARSLLHARRSPWPRRPASRSPCTLMTGRCPRWAGCTYLRAPLPASSAPWRRRPARSVDFWNGLLVGDGAGKRAGACAGGAALLWAAWEEIVDGSIPDGGRDGRLFQESAFGEDAMWWWRFGHRRGGVRVDLMTMCRSERRDVGYGDGDATGETMG